MTRVLDLQLVCEGWQAATVEMERLAAALPDGDARWADFTARMLNDAAETENYLVRRPAARHGQVVILMEPGPMTQKFIEELRGAVAALQGAA